MPIEHCPMNYDLMFLMTLLMLSNVVKITKNCYYDKNYFQSHLGWFIDPSCSTKKVFCEIYSFGKQIYIYSFDCAWLCNITQCPFLENFVQKLFIISWALVRISSLVKLLTCFPTLANNRNLIFKAKLQKWLSFLHFLRICLQH